MQENTAVICYLENPQFDRQNIYDPADVSIAVNNLSHPIRDVHLKLTECSESGPVNS
jgi:hypothetical protein